MKHDIISYHTIPCHMISYIISYNITWYLCFISEGEMTPSDSRCQDPGERLATFVAIVLNGEIFLCFVLLRCGCVPADLPISHKTMSQAPGQPYGFPWHRVFIRLALHQSSTLWALLLMPLIFNSSVENYITSIIKCVLELLIYFESSTVRPLMFGNG